jgi:UDP-N-acetyl-D-mannosaminuronic acid dehydrogenase
MNKKYDVVVIGLGYVGLTLSVALSECGYKVLGVEKRKNVVDLTNSGKAHFQENGLDFALNQAVKNNNFVATTEMQGVICNTYIITVGTPINQKGISRLDYIENATREVMKSMTNDSLVILRSTVKIGTSENIVSKILKSGNKNFYLAMCPERTIEGRALQELTTLPQIIGSNSEEGFLRAEKVFGRLTKTIVKVSSLESAEIIKLIDNTSRDVAFAFANEVARICEPFDVSALEVISSGKLGYERTNVALPGLVGGPCLEKDPHILAQSLSEKGIELEITKACRIVNERQPYETVESIKKESLKRGFIDQVKITIMGLAFKGVPSTDDLRGSMAFKVLDAIEKEFPKANIILYDPVISIKDMQDNFSKHSISEDIEEAVKDASILIFTNNHPYLTKHRPEEFYKIMSENGFIYDYWNRYTNLPKKELKENYFSVGYVGSRK